MKKLLSVVMACLVAAVFMGCSSNSPRSVAEEAMKCVQKGDVRGYMDLVYLSEKDQAQKEAFIQMVEEKAEKNPDEAKKVTGYKFVEESIDEEAGTASEVFDVTYEDGETKQTTIDMMRDDDGKWWVKMSK